MRPVTSRLRPYPLGITFRDGACSSALKFTAPLLAGLLLTLLTTCGGGGSGGVAVPGSVLPPASAPGTDHLNYSLDPSVSISASVQPLGVTTPLDSAEVGTVIQTPILSYLPLLPDGNGKTLVAFLYAAGGEPIVPFVIQPADATTGQVQIGLDRIALGLLALHPALTQVPVPIREQFFQLASAHPHFATLKTGVAALLATDPLAITDLGQSQGLYLDVRLIVEDTLSTVMAPPHALVDGGLSECGEIPGPGALSVVPGQQGDAIIINQIGVFYGLRIQSPGQPSLLTLMEPTQATIHVFPPSFSFDPAKCKSVTLPQGETHITAQAYAFPPDLSTPGGYGTTANALYAVFIVLDHALPLPTATPDGIPIDPAAYLAELTADCMKNGCIGPEAAAAVQDLVHQFDELSDHGAQIILDITAHWLHDNSDSVSLWLWGHFPQHGLSYWTEAMGKFSGFLQIVLALPDLVAFSVSTGLALHQGEAEFCATRTGDTVTISCNPPTVAIPNFTVSPEPGMVGSPIHFDPASTTFTFPPLPNLPTYEWLFDDYDNSTLVDVTTGPSLVPEPVSHVFVQAGLHNIVFRVRIGNSVFLRSKSVVINAQAQPTLCLQPPGPISVATSLGQSPPSQTLTVSNCEFPGTTLEWSAHVYPQTNWLSVSPTTGVVPYGAMGQSVDLSFDSATLPVGVYAANVEFINSANQSFTTIVPVTLSVNSSSCGNDVYEPNNTCAAVTDLSTNTPYLAYICPQGDEDWYSFTLDTSQQVGVILSCPHDPCADYDVELYSSCGSSPIGSSHNGCGQNDVIIVGSDGTLQEGTYYVRVYGVGGAFDASRIYGLAVAAVGVAPQVSVSPVSGPQGTLFNQPGSGFTSNGGVTLHFRKPDGTEYPTAHETANGGGSYSHSYQSGSSNPIGQYQYWAIDDTTGISSNTFNFSITALTPQVSVSPVSGPQGTLFSQPGSGFTPNGGVTLHFRKPDGTEYPTTPETANSNGSYSHSYQSGSSNPIGQYQYWAIDDTTGISSNTFNFWIL